MKATTTKKSSAKSAPSKAAPKSRTSASSAPAPKKPRARAVGKSSRSAATVPVTFRIQAATDVPVFLAGTFNDWNQESIRLEGRDGLYSVTLDLCPGSYEYKFIVNGFWTMDPDPAREWVPNGMGTLNSVIVVR